MLILILGPVDDFMYEPLVVISALGEDSVRLAVKTRGLIYYGG